MKPKVRAEIAALIRRMIEKKLANYSPETANMPFFQELFSKEEMHTASIIQSFYTSFGMSVYEQMTNILAKSAGYTVDNQYHLLGTIDKKTESLITEIHSQLRSGANWDDLNPIKKIKSSIKQGKGANDNDSVVDLHLITDECEYFLGITTVKPNKEGFSTHARKMLRWLGLKLSQDKNSKVNVGLVIPYNPYEPKPYDRWNCRKMFGKQLYVGRDYWNFVAGEKVYDELLDIFKEVGKEMRPRIREKIKGL